ncbi:AAA family ATPase [Halochromatium salexigens]|uniref:AAA family ATPase n=2 Tax=Halochromatium salexigens TaxID=49447 RepID=A0AAJ0UJD8_HALSE|nr:AAA family ATPase [Halochromatium salexigens]
MARPKQDGDPQDRRRFAFEHAGELWMSDVMHGPSVVVGERVKRKTYLIAFIDDATRVIAHAAFAMSENTASFLPVLEQAVLRRGLPKKLYVDNGANYRSKHLLELRGIGLVTGEAGSGKTTVCRKVAADLHPGLYRVFYIPLSTGNVMDMYKTITWELGLPVERNRAAAFRRIRLEITRLTLEAKQRPVLIVDEAHHLRNEVLEDLRLLTNYNMDSENRLCLLLVGLTELRRRLTMAVHESLAQRIVVRHHLSGLMREEVPEYLCHRLRLAGCEVPLFEPAAVEALFQATQGMPRKVNRLAHYALTSAALAQARQVSAEHVQAAREEVAA